MSEAASQQPCATVFRLDQQALTDLQQAIGKATELGDDYEVVVRAELMPSEPEEVQTSGSDVEVASVPGIEDLARRSNSGDVVEWKGERYLVVKPDEPLEIPAEQFASLFGITG